MKPIRISNKDHFTVMLSSTSKQGEKIYSCFSSLYLLFQLLFRVISKPNIKKTHNVTSLERKLNYFRAEAVDKDGV
jgi:hypothetical protein